jgi:hypothetical protein
VLLLFLFLAVVVIIGIIVVIGGDVHDRFQRRTLGALALAHPPVFFESIEDLAKPPDHLFDRRRWAGRTGLAARTRLAARALRARLSLRTGLALNTGLALRTRLAACAVGTAPPRMTLRTWPSRLALLAVRARWPLSSPPARQIVRQLRYSRDVEGVFLSRRSIAASIARTASVHVLNSKMKCVR